jgi:hypothetical protein
MTAIKHGSTWGNWTLDAEVLVLSLRDGRSTYEIDLEDITDSAHMLDWIFQIRMKTWSTNDTIGDLISAFQDIFRPQGSLCGGGSSGTIDATAFLKKRLAQSLS